MKKPSSYRIVQFFTFVFVFSLFANPLNAQSPGYKFENLNVEHGLSNNSVNDIIQDKNGFLWIATGNGLNKFDGYKFTVFKNNPDDPHSLSHNNIKTLLDTEIYGRQIIWIGTHGGGLNAMDVETEKFIHWLQAAKDSSWDGQKRLPGSVLFDSSAAEFKMWYTGGSSPFWDTKIGYAAASYKNSAKDLEWKKYDLNPVLDTGKPGSWDAYYVIFPSVIKYNNIYHMWYVGSSRLEWPDSTFIGYATSPDGIKWTKYAGNPVLKPGGEGAWEEEESLFTHCVIHDGNLFHMWYAGVDDTWERGDINHAVSEDGINWKKDPNNPVLKRGPIGSWKDKGLFGPAVHYSNGVYHMWFGASTYSYSEHTKIAYATSRDGIVWSESPGPVLKGRTGIEHNIGVGAVLLRDNEYLMWYGEGLWHWDIRYMSSKDGKNFQRDIRNKIWKQDQAGLTSNFITSVHQDRSGAIWIGNVGLGGFQRLKIPDKTEWLNLFAGGMDDYTWKFDNYLQHKSVSYLTEDTLGNLWIAAYREGIFQYNLDKNEFYHYKVKSETPNYTPSITVLTVHCDNNGDIWAGLGNGELIKLVVGKDHSEYTLNSYKTESASGITKIYEEKNEKLLLCSSSNGLKIFDKRTESILPSIQTKSNFEGLENNNYYSITKDKSGIIWLGSEKGIIKLTPQSKQFVNYKYDPKQKNSLSYDSAGPIIESDYNGNKILWIGTLGGGLNKLDRTKNQYTHYKHDPKNPNSLGDNNVISMHEDKKGKIWIGTSTSLNEFDPVNEKFTIYRNDPHDNLSLSRGKINSILNDRSGDLYIGNFGFQKKMGNLNKFSSITVGSVQAIYENGSNSDKILWLGTLASGMIKFATDTRMYIQYVHDPNDPYSISHNNVNCITGTQNDGTEILWIGTNRGLNKVVLTDSAEGNTGKLRFINYTEKDGLPNNLVYGILEDDIGNLWLSTNKGISRFDPVNETFRNYDKSDGLQGNEFNFNSYYKSDNGEMFFGCKTGLTSFYPDSIADNIQAPNIVLTDFRLFNKPVAVMPDSIDHRDKFYLAKNISYLDTLELSYKENVFSFEFAALDYQNPGKNKYAYMMEGFDKNWTQTNADERRVTYTNLDPGEYTFRVKGSNNDEYWNEAGKALVVIITPPWWATTWAYSGYIIIILLIVYAIWRFQLSRIRLRHTAEIEHLEAEKYREMDSMKSRFFANISHEFRTPLTLILGPVENMLAKANGGKFTKDLKLVKRNAKRLFNLINQLLDLSKLESNKMSLKAGEYNIVPFIKGLVMSFVSLAERKNILLKVGADEPEVMVYFDKEIMNKIISNLISNAFKFTDSGGRIDVSIKRIARKTDPDKDKSLEGHVEIEVKDTGMGIPPDRLEKIFDRFYQVDGSHTREREGTGIGLSLTKELVELHKGEISVESEEGNGTTFTLRFRLGKAHFKPEEITDTAQPEQEYETFIDEAELLVANRAESEISEIEAYAVSDKPIVLVVEDNADVRNYVKDYLHNKYTLIEADNGLDGLNIALEHIPDLILSDIMMPKMNGVELCNKLKNDERTSHIPVILLTAKASGEDKIEGLETGADDYIMKPFDARELQVRIRNLIDQRKRLREHFKKQGLFEIEEDSVTPADKKFLQRAIRVINSHISDVNLNVNSFAEEMALSRSQLHRKFTALYNETPSDFIRRIRLSKAAKLLEQHFGNISEVALEVGFNNPAYFTQCFKEQFKKTPSEYEKSM